MVRIFVSVFVVLSLNTQSFSQSKRISLAISAGINSFNLSSSDQNLYKPSSQLGYEFKSSLNFFFK